MFDSACVATPASLTAAVGTRVLVANHSSATSGFVVKDRKETLEPYHYMASVLKTAGEFAVTCNGKDTATVTVK